MGNDDDYGDVNGGHNLVHDDNKHNGKNPTLAGGRPPSAWQIIVMFVFSNTWESNKEDIEKRVVQNKSKRCCDQGKIITSIMPLSPGLRTKLDGGILSAKYLFLFELPRQRYLWNPRYLTTLVKF